MSASDPEPNSEMKEIAEIVENFPDYSCYVDEWNAELLALESYLAEKCILKSVLSKVLDAYLKGSRAPHAVVSVRAEKYVQASALASGKRSFEPTAKKYFRSLAEAASVLLEPRGWRLEHTALSTSGIGVNGSFFYNAIFEFYMIF